MSRILRQSAAIRQSVCSSLSRPVALNLTTTPTRIYGSLAASRHFFTRLPSRRLAMPESAAPTNGCAACNTTTPLPVPVHFHSSAATISPHNQPNATQPTQPSPTKRPFTTSASSPSLVSQDQDGDHPSTKAPPHSHTAATTPGSPISPHNPSFSSPAPGAYTTLQPSHSADSTRHSELAELFANNRAWARSVEQQYPGFFNALSKQQKPKYMWIGCSDSRVPASEITGLMPGEVFVHRNVGNCVVNADLNMLSCLQFAVDVLKVEHVIVCGHYRCGAVEAALQPKQIGLADNWVRNIKDIARRHREQLGKYASFAEKASALTELHVVAQVENVCHSTIVQNAWRRGQSLAVHGWVYGVSDGLLKNLVEPSIKGFDQISAAYHVEAPEHVAEP